MLFSDSFSQNVLLLLNNTSHDHNRKAAVIITVASHLRDPKSMNKSFSGFKRPSSFFCLADRYIRIPGF